MKPFTIGITGGSGSGKTFFLTQLLKYFEEDQICHISQDNYYISRDRQVKDENGVSNFDHIDSIDLDTFSEDVRTLIDGNEVKREEYTFNKPAGEPNTLHFHPAPIIIVEGIFVFHHPQISEILDLKVYMEAKDHIRLKRRIIRDQQERGYDLDEILYRYEKHVIPTYEKYIEPFRHECDIIIPNNSGIDEALILFVSYLKTKV